MSVNTALAVPVAMAIMNASCALLVSVAANHCTAMKHGGRLTNITLHFQMRSIAVLAVRMAWHCVQTNCSVHRCVNCNVQEHTAYHIHPACTNEVWKNV